MLEFRGNTLGAQRRMKSSKRKGQNRSQTSTVSEWDANSSRFPAREYELQWLFGFLKTDLRALTAGQLLDMRRDALEFVQVDKGPSITSDQLPTLGLLAKLQSELAAGIRLLQQGECWMINRPVAYGLWSADDHLVKGHFNGSFRDLFTVAMADATQEAWPRLANCQRPDCGVVVLKTGKQTYCSPRCSQLVRWDRFKAGRAPRNYHEERQTAFHRKTNAAAKIGVRRRTAS